MSTRPREGAAHRRQRKARSQAVRILRVAAGLIEPHHGSSIPLQVARALVHPLVEARNENSLGKIDMSESGLDAPGAACALLSDSARPAMLEQPIGQPTTMRPMPWPAPPHGLGGCAAPSQGLSAVAPGNTAQAKWSGTYEEALVASACAETTGRWP